MSPSAGARVGTRSSRQIGFALAIVLPAVATVLTAQLPALQSLPFALYFLSVATVASVDGLASSLLCVAISVAAHNALYFQGHHRLPLLWVEGMRTSIIVLCAATVSLVTRRRRRAAEDLALALKELQDRTTALIESQQASKCASWTYDSRDRTRWSPGGFEVFGIPFAELEEIKSQITLILPEDQARVRQAVEEMIGQRKPLHAEYRVLFPNGELHWSETRGNPVPHDVHLWRGITFDITERKLAETALLRSEKLAAMGRLASTVAHEINNPLEAVTNLLYLARKDQSLSPATQAHLTMAEAELARLSNITRLTLGFVRTGTGSRDLEVASVLEDVLSIFRHRCEMKNIRLERRYTPGVSIHIASHELRQIATNLIANAVDALADAEGCIRITVEHQAEDEKGFAVLRMEDNGSGVDPQHLARIFDPFFTTKADVGTGIGLWITRELVEKNGGRISVESGELPEGMRTSFRIRFPACADSSRADARSSDSGALRAAKSGASTV